MIPNIQIQDDNGNTTQVDENGKPLVPTENNEELDSGISLGGNPDAIDLSKVEVVEDNDPRLQGNPDAIIDPALPVTEQPPIQPTPSPEQAEIQALLGELRAEREASKQAAEQAERVAEAQKHVDKINAEYIEAAKEAESILRKPGAFNPKSGTISATAAREMVTSNAKIGQLAAEFANAQKELQALKEPPKETKVENQALADWEKANSHWLMDPQYANALQAAKQIDVQYQSQGYDNKRPEFWNAVTASLKAMGHQIPDTPLNNFGAPPILNNMGGSAFGHAPNARRQTGAPTTGVGTRTVSSPNTGQGRDLSAAEYEMAKLFGNHKGANLKLLKQQMGKS